MQVFSEFLTKAEWGRVQLKPRDTIRDMLETPGSVVATTSLTPLIFENQTLLRVVFISALHELRKAVFLPWWTRVVIVASSSKNSRIRARFRWLRQGDKESGEEFLKRANQHSFLNAAGWRDTELVSASMRKDYMMTLVRNRAPCNSLQAHGCYVMPQGDVITIDNWVPAAESKPLVKLADAAVRFTPKESETPSAFTVAERNV